VNLVVVFQNAVRAKSQRALKGGSRRFFGAGGRKSGAIWVGSSGGLLNGNIRKSHSPK